MYSKLSAIKTYFVRFMENGDKKYSVKTKKILLMVGVIGTVTLFGISIYNGSMQHRKQSFHFSKIRPIDAAASHLIEDKIRKRMERLAQIQRAAPADSSFIHHTENRKKQ